MAERFFVDTNILVYAHDAGSQAKHDAAGALLERLWEDRSGALSTQVLQEFCVNVRRKAAHPMSAAEVRQVVEDYLCWTVVVNDGSAILRGLELAERFRISFWDALIVDAAHQSRSSVLYSEDLNHGQAYGPTTVVNPFLS